MTGLACFILHKVSGDRLLSINRIFSAVLSCAAAAVVMLALQAGGASAKTRHALIIGNAAYQHAGRLENTIADAEAYADVFHGLGFQVTLLSDLDRSGLEYALADFYDGIAPGDTAVFVFSGHGWSDGAVNYILPTDIRIENSERRAKLMSTPLQNGVNGIIDQIRDAGAAVQVAIIDACRDNIFAGQGGTRSVGMKRGLAIERAPQGAFLIFSAGAGEQALDGLPEDQSGPTAKDPVDDYRATFIRYGVYFLAAGVLVALILQGDRWLIKSNLGLAELGLYGAILTIASVTTNLVFSFMSQLMTPVIFQKFGSSHGDAREGKQAYRTYILLSAGIFFVALALITMLREPVILLLTDRTFLAAAALLPILTAAQAIEKMGQSVTLRGLAALRTWPYLWARLIQLLVLLGGGYYGVMTNGIVGVAYAQLAACACYFLVTWSTNWVLLDMPRRDAGAKG